jgi:hypothetical protein
MILNPPVTSANNRPIVIDPDDSIRVNGNLLEKKVVLRDCISAILSDIVCPMLP